ncbi:Crp/Fnr family transcriptional regulator [Rhizobium sp. TRM96647]|uniref:Crp/Fnr family transcriptional regulator n=1 Tax=unclassified Rhizobium TaxID=2613769 RepID=UPI001E504655|nr:MULTISPECIES: Crp/Fnr family transcriptional regulator [unclassified Rhizobium]MCD2183602.1 Crp/Fnr family transcriptional regulator [Rhizobium sp. GN54]MCV3736618.1 Crp/Fnr family transcriptional regulator [Rhizobium sp. TRM96647]MCV3758987.1 Crp/Fnr family transcriptional regulator [Rhizobium sp. TRM96650]
MNEVTRSTAFWRSFPIFEGFNKETIADLATIANYRKWKAGTVLFQRGDEGTYLIVVISGRIKISLLTPQGKELTLRHLEAGSIFGELAILDGQPRSADATAMIATEGYVISKRDFLEVLTRNAQSYQSIIHYLCTKLRETTEQLETIALYDLDSRVARFFLAMLRNIHGNELPESANLQLALSQTDIASIVGASRPKINRSILTLEDVGAIRRNTDGIIFCHTGRLLSVAEPEDE